MSRGRQAALREPDVRLPDLHAATSADLENDSEYGFEHDGLDFAGLALPEFTAGNQHFVECRFVACRFGEVKLRRARFSTCRLDDLEATTFDVAESEWSDVVVGGGRLGALLMPGAKLTRVAFDHVRANYLNLRGAEIVDLALRNCRIEELDLSATQIRRADLSDSEIERLILTDAGLSDVDLQQADLAVVEGVAHLRGATISEHQLSRLAPALAAHIGIRVT
jgi:uncharacterized protein YjbI with pentapeptide repeats